MTANGSPSQMPDAMRNAEKVFPAPLGPAMPTRRFTFDRIALPNEMLISFSPVSSPMVYAEAACLRCSKFSSAHAGGVTHAIRVGYPDHLPLSRQCRHSLLANSHFCCPRSSIIGSTPTSEH